MIYKFTSKQSKKSSSPLRKKSAGFTLIETMVAVFILTLALTGLLSLNSNSIFAARYARNEISANYLTQEAADGIRNDRDTTAFLGGDWNAFLTKYGPGNSTCFDKNKGCYIDFTDRSSGQTPVVAKCNVQQDFGASQCPSFNYDDTATYNSFYTYQQPSSGTYPKSNFKRQVIMSLNAANPDELDVMINVEWLNGSLVHAQSLQTSIFRWR
jgi:prepilin-type N-terminal cleavage/methylation domain-containing protein